MPCIFPSIEQESWPDSWRKKMLKAFLIKGKGKTTALPLKSRLNSSSNLLSKPWLNVQLVENSWQKNLKSVVDSPSQQEVSCPIFLSLAFPTSGVLSLSTYQRLKKNLQPPQKRSQRKGIRSGNQFYLQISLDEPGISLATLGPSAT